MDGTSRRLLMASSQIQADRVFVDGASNTLVVPAWATVMHGVAIAGTTGTSSSAAYGGGGLSWANDIAVTPGESLTVVCDQSVVGVMRGTTWLIAANAPSLETGGAAYTLSGQTSYAGGNGRIGHVSGEGYPGGGGAAGYLGNGGNGGTWAGAPTAGSAGAGGGGGGGSTGATADADGFGGGGTGLYGVGASGSGGGIGPGQGGSGGGTGSGRVAGEYGGGSGGGPGETNGPASSAVRVIFGRGYGFPFGADVHPMPPIERIGSATGTSSVTLPTHQAGDLILVFSFYDGIISVPSLPSGFTTIGSGSVNSCGSRLSYKFATDASTTIAAQSNTTSMVAHVYRNVKAIGVASGLNGASTTITYNALTLHNTDGTSWVAGFAGHRSTNTSLETAPTNMTNVSTVADATDEAAGHDTNGGVTSWASTAVSVGGTSSGWHAWVAELEAY